MQRIAALVVFFGCFFLGPALAQTASILPEIPKAAGNSCVADTRFMRVNHMNLLKHDRDETVLLGDRKVKYSLKECVECHAVEGVDAKPVGFDSDKHFCRVCHDYVAVKIDCFQCHNSRPEIIRETLSPANEDAVRELAAYLDGVEQ
jgi:hypothetical protein